MSENRAEFTKDEVEVVAEMPPVVELMTVSSAGLAEIMVEFTDIVVEVGKGPTNGACGGGAPKRMLSASNAKDQQDPSENVPPMCAAFNGPGQLLAIVPRPSEQAEELSC